MNTKMSPQRRRWLLGAIGVLLLATVFWAYTQPAFIVALVDTLWSCF